MSKTDGHSLLTNETTTRERNAVHVKRTKVTLKPDPSRVLMRPFTPGDHQQVQGIVTSILSISESGVGLLLDEVCSKFFVYDSGDVKGTITGAIRCHFVPSDVRRHRLISSGYIKTLCHGRGREFESRRPRHCF